MIHNYINHFHLFVTHNEVAILILAIIKKPNMPTYYFKTNINCTSCIRSISPQLESANAIKSWEVDIMSDDKRMKVESDLSEGEVIAIIEDAGFKAEKV